MTNTLSMPIASHLILAAETAADIMVASPVSLRASAGAREALDLFTQRGISAAPVIDEAGHPIGVLSRTDLMVHDREMIQLLWPHLDYFSDVNPKTKNGEALPSGTADLAKTSVRELMTPAVFSVRPETPAAKVVSEMLALRVHRLFVVDPDGVLVGVISALDILKHLRP